MATYFSALQFGIYQEFAIKKRLDKRWNLSISFNDRDKQFVFAVVWERVHFVGISHPLIGKMKIIEFGCCQFFSIGGDAWCEPLSR